jgi:Family of unknown function (DUF6502)
MRRQTRRTKTVISRGQAISLLHPIAAFFNSGGLSRDQALNALSAAIENVCREARKRDLEHIGAPACYAELIAAWTRDRRFLDSNGRPRALALSGPRGFTALAKLAAPGESGKSLLRVLIRYRNVRKLSSGKIQLVSPFFHATTHTKMAFEPMVLFLNDATSTMTRILRNPGEVRGPEPFWRKVETVRMSKAAAKKFSEYARERSLMFLEEMDDWQRAHTKGSSARARKSARVGLGLFSIYSH